MRWSTPQNSIIVNPPNSMKKNKGAGYMVSFFTSAKYGVLPKSTLVLEIGVNKEGYHKGDDFLNLFQLALIECFELQGPSIDCCFLFDNSTNHNCMSLDALVANKVTLMCY